MRVMLRTALVASMATSGLGAQSAATPSVILPAADRPIELALVADQRGVVPGRALTIGLRLRPKPEWHTYWRYAGDVGSAPGVQWQLPMGFHAGELAWPSPTLISAPPLASYGYPTETYLLTSIDVPGSARIGSRIAIGGIVTWVACKVECLAGDATLSLTLPVVRDAIVDSSVARTFEAVRAELPTMPQGWTFNATADSSYVSLIITSPRGELTSRKALSFFVDTQAVIDHAATQIVRATQNGASIRIRRSEYSTAMPRRLRGVLVVTDTSNVTSNDTLSRAGRSTPRRIGIIVDAEVVVARHVANVAESRLPAQGDDLGLIVAVAFALIGGTLLNVMPCVLPVLSLKAVRIAESAGRDAMAARRDALLYSGGVVLSMWVLVGALLTLRGLGHEVGWGFQLQDPVIVGVLSLLIFAAALNMSGVFEVTATWAGTVASRPSTTSSFAAPVLNGVLVTALATPCSAPFLASAVAFGLTHGSVDTVLVFTALGAGLSWPVLAIAWSPRLRGILPKPGAWMVTLRQALAFPLYATAAWLTWLVGREAGLDAVARVLVALIGLAIGLWTYGRFGTVNNSSRVRRASILSAVAAGAVSIFLVARIERIITVPVSSLTSSADALPMTADDGESVWEAFTPTRLAQYRAEGRIILLDFTADWCLTCKVNEKVAFASAPVRAAIAARHIVLLRADWTRRDADITRAIAAFNRNSVPLVVLYSGERNSIVLPTLLSPGALIRAFDVMADSSKSASTSVPNPNPTHQ